MARGTRSQRLRNNYIRKKYPRSFSPGTPSETPESPRSLSPRSSSSSSQLDWMVPAESPPLSPRSSSQWNWMVPASAATAGMMYTSKRRHAGRQSSPTSSTSSTPFTPPSAMIPYKSHVTSLPITTSMTYDPAQGMIISKSSPRPYAASTSAGGSFALLAGTLAAATLAARKRRAQASRKK